MPYNFRRVSQPMADYVNTRIVRWRTGTREGQIAVLVVLSAMAAAITVVTLVGYQYATVVAFIIPMLLGTLTLRYWPLVLLVIVTGVGVLITIAHEGLTTTRVSALIMIGISALIILAGASRIRSGLPGPLSEAMLLDLRDRLYAQGKVPPLPQGWKSQSAMKSAGGAKFAGDFMVAGLSDCGTILEMVLVDVCGKGVTAGTQSLHFSGALGGLIGALSPEELFVAANRFLLRQNWEDGFATAVHVTVNLKSGEFSIINAGHPPALRWETTTHEWGLDGARGIALGITPDPEFHMAKGELAPGDALLFYTDGVVESHDVDVMTGIEWLRGTAKAAVSNGFDNAAKTILDKVSDSDDDRAVLILSRDLVASGETLLAGSRELCAHHEIPSACTECFSHSE